MLEALKDTNLTVAKVSALKESLPELWNYLRVGWASSKKSGCAGEVGSENWTVS